MGDYDGLQQREGTTYGLAVLANREPDGVQCK